MGAWLASSARGAGSLVGAGILGVGGERACGTWAVGEAGVLEMLGRTKEEPSMGSSSSPPSTCVTEPVAQVVLMLGVERTCGVLPSIEDVGAVVVGCSSVDVDTKRREDGGGDEGEQERAREVDEIRPESILVGTTLFMVVVDGESKAGTTVDGLVLAESTSVA